MKKRGNINIKLTNILKQTQECCNKKKCPKGSKRCKLSKKRRKKDEVGIFGGMPNIRPTSRAIPMPQSVINNISPVPNIPMPIQLPAYSQFRRPPSMYQRNDRPLQVQQGRGVRQPERQPLMVSAGIQTARQQAIAQTQTARRQAIAQTQTARRQAIAQTQTRGVRSDREIRGRTGTADQPFKTEQPTPNILDYEAILMRNAEEDRRLATQRRIEMRDRFQSTLQDIGEGTPRAVEIEEEVLDQQIEGVKQLIGSEDEALNQGQTGSVRDLIDRFEPTAQIDDEPVRTRRGRPNRGDSKKIKRRMENLREQGFSSKQFTPMEILAMPEEAFNFSSDDEEGVETGASAGAGFV